MRFSLWFSSIVLCLGLANNALAHPTENDGNSIYPENSVLYSYIYNDAGETVLNVSTSEQSFQNFTGQWQISKNSAHFLRNITLYTYISAINYSGNTPTYTSHKVHIDIQHRGKSIGTCDTTYFYTGFPFDKTMNPRYPFNYLELPSIQLGTHSCTPGFTIAVRNSNWFDNSLILYRT